MRINSANSNQSTSLKRANLELSAATGRTKLFLFLPFCQAKASSGNTNGLLGCPIRQLRLHAFVKDCLTARDGCFAH